MNFFNNPLTAEQFHNAFSMVQETSNLVATHNASNPDNEVSERTLRNWNTENEYRKPSEEQKANVLMCMTEADVELYNEARKAVASVKGHVDALRAMGTGLKSAIEGNTEARRTRLWLSALDKHLEAANAFTSAIHALDWNFGELDASDKYQLPTRQHVKELNANCRANGEGIKWETEKLLANIADAAQQVVMAVRALPFPENSKQELLDAANEHVGDGTPRVYGDTMVDALVKTMQGLTPKPCVEADLGARWERPVKELAAFDALRACVTLSEREEARVAEWHTNALAWIEKRAQVAQG